MYAFDDHNKTINMVLLNKDELLDAQRFLLDN